MPRQHRLRKVSRPHSRLLFDNALLTISHYLAEAQFAREQGDCFRREKLLAKAEAHAVQTGYVELMQLVWAYADAAQRVTVS